MALLFLLGLEARELFDPDRERGEARLQRARVLRGEQGGRAEQRDLLLVGDGLEDRAHRDLGLAVADVTAHQAVHRLGRLHVALGVVDRFGLIGRGIVGERLLELGLPGRVGREGVTARDLALGVQLDQPVGDLLQVLRDARLGAGPVGAAHLGEARRGAFGRCELRDLVHLVHRHQHAVRAGVLEVEVVAPRAQDRLGAQAEILADAVHGVHHVVADLQVGQRDRDAFLDGAELDALGGLAEYLAVAQYVQVQRGDGEAALERALVDVDRAALAHQRHAVGAGGAQMDEGRAALGAHAGGAHDLGHARGAGRDQPHRVARLDPLADLLGEHLDAAVEMLGRPRFQHERVGDARQPEQLAAALDAAGDDQHAPPGEPLAVVVQVRVRRDHVGQQRLAHFVVAHVQLARVHPGHQHFRAARALVVEAAVDGREHAGLFEHHQRVAVEVVEHGRALVVGQRKPGLGHVGPGRQVRAQCGDDARLAGGALQHRRAQRLVAQDLQPRRDRDLVERAARALRGQVEGPNRLDLVTEELDPHRQVGGGREDVEDAAPHRVLAGRADHVDACVAQPVEPLLGRLPARFLVDAQGEGRVLEDAARHDVLAQRGDRGHDHLRLARAQIGQQGHARAALRGRLDRADRLVARAQQRHRARLALAQEVGQVGEGPLGHVAGRDDDEDLPPQRAVQRGQQVGPGAGGRLVQPKGEPPLLRERGPQALDQLGERPGRRGKGTDERRREGVGHGPPLYHEGHKTSPPGPPTAEVAHPDSSAISSLLTGVPERGKIGVSINMADPSGVRRNCGGKRRHG